MQIRNLDVVHKTDLRPIIEDLTFFMNPGDKIALIGEEGNGKSTLVKLMAGVSSVNDYVDVSGHIDSEGESIGYLPQSLEDRYDTLSVYEYMCELEAFHELQPGDLAEVAKALNMSIDKFYDHQTMRSHSGGEKVKLQLARILMSRPDILLLDEPSNDLDLATLGWLENFVIKDKRPILYISHDETFVERTANKILHLELIRRKTKPRYTIYKGDFISYRDGRDEKMAHQEQVATNQRLDHKKQMARYRQIHDRVEHEQKVISRGDPSGGRLLKKKMKAVKSQEKRFEKQAENFEDFPEKEEAIYFELSGDGFPAGKILVDKTLSPIYMGERLLLNETKLLWQGPMRIGIIGANGTGKSTLIKELVRIMGENLSIKLGYMPQNYEDRLPMDKTPVAYLQKTFDKDEATRIRTYLGSLKFTADEMDHEIKELSGGQKAKMLLLKMSMEGCQVLVLDEPSRNFSPMSNPVLRAQLKHFNGAIISVSHDRKYLSEVVDHLYLLENQMLREVDKSILQMRQ